ncbi:MarR family winged helix-turn-helix transcriptional regulator [Actinoplanes subtropicus]|uniref:MarR family winged helix-turn-helix transcriptional regulator n=1 Tax=Actinoplanes subtropicus TaxID=543632 RepID=UPI0004C4616A|nr:MarR family winged helix-turn-helix transcriptional regulator [Actinoplanes subtropicus]
MKNTAAVERRRLTSAELAVWRSLFDTTAELRRRLAAQLAADSGLSPGDYAVLLALAEAAGRRLRSSELADAIDWERSRLSHHVGRMEKRGLIERVECATDSRGAEVVLTEDGARIFRNATAPHARAIKRHFGDALSPAQFDALDDILRALTTHLEATR